ncbi:MAG: polyprenyl synthetase family protein, partial [Syntrophales bacterium]|nr:polyprenyl synthetase family protein [Syntrophales bacterium]
VGMEVLYDMHARKTGAMILVSVTSGARLAGADEKEVAALADYGRHIGLAFQIADDILNVTGDKVLMGKNTGSDAYRGKVTFPALMGIEASRAKLRELVGLALAALAPFDDKAEPLRLLADYIVEREF